MSEHSPTTGPVVLPPNPTVVADGKVHELSSLGNLHKPPTEREYEHAGLDTALQGGTEQEVFAILNHLGSNAVQVLSDAAHWLESACEATLRDREARRG